MGLDKNSVSFQILRGFGYASISFLTLFSGYLIQNSFPDTSIFFLLLVLFFLSSSFFVVYGFTYRYSLTANHWSKYEPFFLSLLISVLIALIIFLITRYTFQQIIIDYILLISYFFIFITYSIFYLRNIGSERLSLMRHQLVYPVILSISVSMYVGMNFNSFAKDMYTYLPLLIIFLSFSFLEFFLVGKKLFLFVNIFLILSSLVFIILSRIYNNSSLSNYFSSMLFAVFFATYLAVFESWRIVSYTFNHGRRNHSRDDEKGTDYYYATLLSIAFSLIFLPLGFILGAYDIIFLLGFLFHGLISFYYWNKQGKSLQNISSSDWISQKLFFGFGIIAILIIDTFIKIQTVSSFMSGFVSLGGFSIPLAIYIPILILSNDFKKSEDTEKSIYDRMKIFYINNPFRIVTLLAFLFCFIFLIIKDISSLGDISIRINYIYLVFSIYIYAGIIYEIGKPNKNIRNVSASITIILLGIFQITRFITSLFIYSIIAIPLLVNHQGIYNSFIIPLPILLLVMGGFSLNDYFDSYRDSINKPYRAIPTGKLTKNTALILSIFLLTLSIIYSIVISTTIFQQVLYYISIVGVISYNYVVSKFAFSKTIFTSLLCNIPFILLINILDYPNMYLFLPLSGILFIIGRELLMDILDETGDSKSNIRTIPIIIGSQKTKYIAFISQVLGLAFTIPLITYLHNQLLFLATIILFVFYLLMVIGWHLFNHQGRLSIIKLMWIQMLASILFFI